jgi:uncharacterized protein YggE
MLDDLDALEPTMDAIVGAGIDQIYGTDFQTTELRAHRDEARGLALEAAREKAVAMAARLGQTLGAPLQIREGTSFMGSPLGAGISQNVTVSQGSTSGVGATIPGRVPVRADVTVVFALGD